MALKKLKPKDTGNDLVLETDEFRNVTSILGLRFNGGQKFDPKDFVIMAYLSIFETPTGMADLRCCYSRWWLLDTALKLRAVGLNTRAFPILTGQYATAQQKPSLEAALANARQANWLSIPEDAKVTALELAGRSDQMFADAIKDLKHDIFLGIQGAILQALEGNTTGARSMGQVHQDTAALFVWYLRCRGLSRKRSTIRSSRKARLSTAPTPTRQPAPSPRKTTRAMPTPSRSILASGNWASSCPPRTFGSATAGRSPILTTRAMFA